MPRHPSWRCAPGAAPRRVGTTWGRRGPDSVLPLPQACAASTASAVRALDRLSIALLAPAPLGEPSSWRGLRFWAAVTEVVFRARPDPLPRASEQSAATAAAWALRFPTPLAGVSVFRPRAHPAFLPGWDSRSPCCESSKASYLSALPEPLRR